MKKILLSLIFICIAVFTCGNHKTYISGNSHQDTSPNNYINAIDTLTFKDQIQKPYYLRIPFAEVTNKGTLIVGADIRENTTADQTKISIGIVRSTDKGRTFTNPQIIIPHTEISDWDRAMDGTILINRKNGDIFVFAHRIISKNIWEHTHHTGEYGFDCFVTKSSDDGKTWSKPISLKKEMGSFGENVISLFGGVGNGITMEDGTLVLPIQCKMATQNISATNENDIFNIQSGLLYSKDGGKTWQTVNSETFGWTSTIFRRTKLFTDPQADTLFALAGTNNSEVYVWASTDKGLNWECLYYEWFFFGEMIVYPFDIAQYGNNLIFYFSSGIYRLNLVEIDQRPETITGQLIHVDNPPLDNPPLPGMVWALESEAGQYILNYELAWIWADTKLVVNGVEYSVNDSVEINGRTFVKQDINGNNYKELKIKSINNITDAGTDNTDPYTRLLVFPNPASENFAYQSKTPLKNWQVRNISGQLILQGDANQTEIDCQNWPAGLYIFEWETAGGQKGRTKLVKR